MPRPYRVSPYQQDGRQSYIASFYDASGKRVCRGLKTEDFGKASIIAGGLVRLHVAGIKRVEDAPTDSLEAWPFYFPALPAPAPDAALEDVGVDEQQRELEAFIHERMRRLPKSALQAPEIHTRFMAVFQEMGKMRRDLAAARIEVATHKRDLEAEHAARAQLEASVLVKTMESAANAPNVVEALKKYHDSLSSMTPDHQYDMHSRARKFIETLSPETKVSAVTPDAIAAFINSKASAGAADKRATRYAYWRVRLGAFFNWAADTWEYRSQMGSVKAAAAESVKRERGEIDWHDLAEVEAAIAAVPEILKKIRRRGDTAEPAPELIGYWQALIATLGYAGLQLAELVWLRREDLKFSDDSETRASLWITTVEDPDCPESKHLLKTGNRRRHVNVHATLLLPRLKAHLAESAGATFLFAMPPGGRRRARRVEAGSAERWRLDTLSTKLRGHPGGKQRVKTPGLLPAEMNAKSLRRTFGSLLLRSGKKVEQVAAAMGNTPEIVRKHYARLLGSEVDIDF